jgi:GNAT superfamily N-acetyltransferase
VTVVVREEAMDRLADHARISIAFEVTGRFDPHTGAVEPVAEPSTKDYDSIDGAGPDGWSERFDLTNWGLLAAHLGGEWVGGAVVTRDTPNMWMLEGRTDLAFLLDLRVDTAHRGSGVGTALIDAVEAWAIGCGCTELKVETQDINAGACSFYAAMGMTCAEGDPDAYPDLPDETQVIWRKRLLPSSG